jgi:Cytochrome c554 and c-prime
MTDHATFPQAAHAGDTLRLWGAAALLGLVLGIATISAGGTAAPPPAGEPQEPKVGGLPLFKGWPNQKPDAAIVLSGQTFGYLQPCGCSRPQKGGLERRAQLISSLKDKGWPVAGVDLGDIFPEKSAIRDQGLLKYQTTMNALREMGYIAVGVGKTEFTAEIDQVLWTYAMQKEQPPFTLAGNVLGSAKDLPRENRFPPIDPTKSKRPMVGLAEVATVGSVTVGVAGVVGKSLAEEVEKEKLDTSITFEKTNGKVDNGPVMKKAVAELAAKKSQLNILLYQGTPAEAQALAQAVKEFHVILCQSDSDEPPSGPTIVGNTLVIQVGHNGKNVGVLGAFRKGAGYDLYYQLVPLEEFYVTPGPEPAAFKANKSIQLLEAYAQQVQKQDFLGKYPRTAHPSQVQQPKLNLSYVGSARCQNCHQAESAKWRDTKHSTAMDALEKVAKRPSLRQYDGECVRCHTVGFEYNTGYKNEKETAQLKHVGCESCHGPGSGHMTNSKNADLLKLQSPWKVNPEDKLPSVAVMKKLAAMKDLVEQSREERKLPEARTLDLVRGMCMKCHDPENDPHFDILTYWPKIDHPSPKPANGGGGGNNPAPPGK